MARKKQNSDEPKVKFSKINQIWSELSFDDWLVFLRETRNEAEFNRHQGHIKGKCIYHQGDNTPSLMVTPSKGVVKCFGGTCNKVITNPVKFVASVLRCNYGDALLFLRRRYGLKGLIPDALVNHYQAYQEYQQEKKTLADTLHQILVESYVDCDNPRYLFARPLVTWLKKRGVSEVEIHNLGVIPPALYLEKALGETSPTYEFARRYLSASYENSSWLGSLVFFTYDEPDNIARFKLRKPDSKDFLWLEDKYDFELSKFRGFYGLNYYKEFFGDANNPKATTALIVEGEFDAITPINCQAKSGSIDFIILATGGKGTQLDKNSVDMLAPLGITTIGIIPDRDEGGIGFIKHILSQSRSLDLNLQIFEWPQKDRFAYSAKDPDEWIQKQGYAHFSEHVRNIKNYGQPHQWVYEQASKEIVRVSPDDIRQRSRIAVDWGLLLKSAVECKQYCKNLARAFDIDDILLFRELQSHDEDEESYIARILEALKQIFTPVGIDNAEANKKKIELWHRETRATVHMVINEPKSIETTLSNFYGPITEFIKQEVGDPGFLAPADGDTKLKVKVKTDLYRDYVNHAVLLLAKGLPDIASAVRKAQGLHYMGKTSQDEDLSYLVNGKDVYKICGDELDLRVIALQGPQDKSILFKTDASEAWIPSLRRPEDITNVQLDLLDTFNKVHDLVDSGWAFKDQELDSKFVAAYIMCLQVMSVFPRQTSVMFCAESTSGKSKITGGLIGGKEFPKIHLVAATKHFSQYSAAAIRQTTDNSSLALCLEEFEDYGGTDSKSLKVRAILELFRDMISESPVRVTIGTTAGSAKTFSLRYPVICCAIRPLRDEASLSRFVTIELAKSVSRPDPVNVILSKMTELEIEKFRHELALGLIPYMGKLRKLYAEIASEFATGSLLPPKVSSRFKEALYPILSMMKLVGLDYQNFAYKFCLARKEQLTRIASTSENEQIYETILSSPFSIQKGDERISGKTTVRALLASDPNEVNKTKCGVYYDSTMKWLVIHWIEAIQGVLANSVKFNREVSPSYLKTVSDRSPYNVPTDAVTNSRVLDRLRHWMGPGVRISQCTVFNVAELIEESKIAVVGNPTSSATAEQKSTTPAPSAPVNMPPAPPLSNDDAMYMPRRRKVQDVIGDIVPIGDDDLKV